MSPCLSSFVFYGWLLNEVEQEIFGFWSDDRQLACHAFCHSSHNVSKNQVKQVAMPKPKNPDYIDWRKSQAKKVIVTDLEDGVLPADETTVSSEQAWDAYKNLPAFKDVCFKRVLGRSLLGI